jgi:DNA-binding YbaB/EbfC family protein
MAKGFRPPVGAGQANLIKQVKQMQEQLALAQQQLAEETVTASVGGGAVKITMSGAQVCKSVTISADLLKDVDVDMIQDLVLSAVNSALEDSRELAAKKLGPLTGGIPGLGF